MRGALLRAAGLRSWVRLRRALAPVRLSALHQVQVDLHRFLPLAELFSFCLLSLPLSLHPLPLLLLLGLPLLFELLLGWTLSLLLPHLLRQLLSPRRLLPCPFQVAAAVNLLPRQPRLLLLLQPPLPQLLLLRPLVHPFTRLIIQLHPDLVLLLPFPLFLPIPLIRLPPLFLFSLLLRPCLLLPPQALLSCRLPLPLPPEVLPVLLRMISPILLLPLFLGPLRLLLLLLYPLRVVCRLVHLDLLVRLPDLDELALVAGWRVGVVDLGQARELLVAALQGEGGVAVQGAQGGVVAVRCHVVALVLLGEASGGCGGED